MDRVEQAGPNQPPSAKERGQWVVTFVCWVTKSGGELKEGM